MRYRSYRLAVLLRERISSSMGWVAAAQRLLLLCLSHRHALCLLQCLLQCLPLLLLEALVIPIRGLVVVQRLVAVDLGKYLCHLPEDLPKILLG